MGAPARATNARWLAPDAFRHQTGVRRGVGVLAYDHCKIAHSYKPPCKTNTNETATNCGNPDRREISAASKGAADRALRGIHPSNAGDPLARPLADGCRMFLHLILGICRLPIKNYFNTF
jgi:hypothetical protein